MTKSAKKDDFFPIFDHFGGPKLAKSKKKVQKMITQAKLGTSKRLFSILKF